mgnify:FL=1
MREQSSDNQAPPKRSEIHRGDAVWVIEKQNYGTEDYAQGIVAEILSPRDYHPRGIKVRLTDGIVGRVQWFVE